ncbi:hypothetical protein SAMN05660742_1335 [Propionispira arboris]|uniref:Uncharacterized protein n=1 Tax=Propionispira arboris TaxID=84035 RepID=A0A1H7D5U8_9FIRM|nr:hypothetical protein [Propionispira arboris]SEJ97151.1 hypothetical protein SAMN05660742_1335 [Propionispira arboris]
MSTAKTITESKEPLFDSDTIGENTNKKGVGMAEATTTYPYSLIISTYKALSNAGVICYFDVGNIVPITLCTDGKGKLKCNLPADRIYSIDVDYRGTHYKNSSPIYSQTKEQTVRVVELR